MKKVFNIFGMIVLIITLIMPMNLYVSAEEGTQNNNSITSFVDKPHDPIIPGYTTFKIDPPADGYYPKDSPIVHVTFGESDHTMSWELIPKDNISIGYVYIKGGDVEHNKGILYQYTTNTLTDTGLHTIVKNDQNQSISHATFYYKKSSDMVNKTNIIVTKKLVDENNRVVNEDATKFNIIVKDSEHIVGSKDISAGETVNFSELPLSQNYVVSEAQVPVGYELVSIEQSQAIVEGNTVITVIVTNKKKNQDPPPTGSISIEKKLIDSNDQTVNGDATEFTISLTGPNGKVGEKKVKGGETISFNELVLGATYTISEDNVPTGYTKVSIDNQSVTLNSEKNQEKVIVTNRKNGTPTSTESGKITIEKKLIDIDGKDISGDTTEFTINIKGGEVDRNIKLKSGQKISVENLPLGVSYKISEISLPQSYGLVSIDKDTVSLSITNKDVPVVVTNKKTSSDNNNNNNTNSNNNEQTTPTMNQTTSDLPHTGGLLDVEIIAGLAGLVLIAISAILKFKKKA